MGLLSSLFGKTDHSRLAGIIKQGAFLVDVRSAGEFTSGSVKGAVNIPLDTVQSQLVKFKNKKNIIVFCRSGNRSSLAKSILKKNGFTNVINGGTWNNVQNAMNG